MAAVYAQGGGTAGKGKKGKRGLFFSVKSKEYAVKGCMGNSYLSMSTVMSQNEL